MRSEKTYRGARRNAARAEARELKLPIRDVFQPQFENKTRALNTVWRDASRYDPHQGEQEKARRVRQMEARS